MQLCSARYQNISVVGNAVLRPSHLQASATNVSATHASASSVSRIALCFPVACSCSLEVGQALSLFLDEPSYSPMNTSSHP